MEELGKLNYEDGAKLLEALGYANEGSADDEAAGIAERVSDAYYVLYDEKDEEIDRVSWVMYYNLVGEAEDECMDVVKAGWESLGEEEEIDNNVMDAIAALMDDETREKVHYELAPCSNAAFLKRYCELEPDFEKVLKSEFSIKLD